MRILPNDKNLEDAVLGAMMMGGDAVYLAMPRLFPEIFYQDANKAVFQAIRDLYDQNATIDLLTVWGQILKNGTSDKLEGVYYLTKLQNHVVSGTSIETHINLLAELYLKRKLAEIGRETEDSAYQPETDAFDLANTSGRGIEQAQESVLNGIGKDLQAFVVEMIRQHSEVKKTGVLGLKTGLEAIDENIGGLVSPDLIVIAARPGQGKTALALSFTKNLTILCGVPGAWFSLEMDGVQLVRRLTSMLSGIDHERIRSGRTTDQEDAKINEVSAKIADSKLFIEDKPSVNIRDIKTRAHVLHRKYKIKYIVVDYLQLMEGIDVRNKSREQVVSEISRGLKVLAKELGIPVIALSQLNRGVEARPDKMPNLSDLRESGAIEQDADEVIFIMRPEYYGMEDAIEVNKISYSPKELAILNIAKNRHGTTGNQAARFIGAKMEFSNIIQSPF